jgi:hypothetical protein
LRDDEPIELGSRRVADGPITSTASVDDNGALDLGVPPAEVGGIYITAGMKHPVAWMAHGFF